MFLRAVLIFICLISNRASFASDFLPKHTAHCQDHASASACQLKGKGDFSVNQYKHRRNAKNIFVSMNPYMDGELRLYQSKTGNAVNGEFMLDNHSKKNMLIQYQVIFKGKAGLIAKTSGHVLLKQGKRQKINFSDIVLSHQDLNNIQSYEIKLNTK